MIVHHARNTPNDAEFDYEIPDVLAVYKNNNSLATVRECIFGIAVYDLLDEATLSRILLEVTDTEVQTTIRNILDVRRASQNAGAE